MPRLFSLWHLLIWSSLLASGTGFVWAQKKELSFQSVGVESGLSNFYVGAFSQDRDGFMWIGTSDGLNRYDGYQFRHYRFDPEDPNSLSDRSVTSLVNDAKGRLWVGTENGLTCLDPLTDKLERFLPDPKNPNALGHGNIREMVMDHKDQLWIATFGGLFLMTQSDPPRFVNKLPKDRHRTLRSNAIRAMVIDRQQRIWLGTLEGLHCYDPATDKVRFVDLNLPSTRDPRVIGVFSLAIDDSGALWVGSGDGLYQERPDGGWIHYGAENVEEHGLTGRVITSILFDQEQRLWVGTSLSGVFLRESGLTRFNHYRKDSGDAASLSNDQISRLYQDRTGGLWIGNAGYGFDYVDPAVLRLAHFRPTFPTGYRDEGVWCFEKEGENKLWIGTGSGLLYWDRVREVFEHYQVAPEAPDDVETNTIRSLLKDSQNRLWLGLRLGLARFDREKKQVIRYPWVSGPHVRSVRDLLEDRNGVIWAASYQAGLLRYDPAADQFTAFDLPPGNQPLPDLVRCLREDQRGNLWVGTHEGLARLDPTRQTMSLFFSDPLTDRSRIMGICEHAGKKGIWIGTHNGGLGLFQPATGEVLFYTTKDGLPSNLVYGAEYDNQGALWIPTLKGLARLDPEEEVFTVFNTSHGLESEDSSSGSFTQSDGLFLLGGTKGFNAYYPRDLMKTPSVAQTELTRFWLNGKEMGLQSEDPRSPLTLPIEQTDLLHLNHRQNAFSIDFAHLSFYSPQKNRYAFTLEGFDTQWTEADSSRRTATYTNIGAGKYLFRVKGMGKHGIWSEAQPLTLVVDPAPWFTLGAYFCYGLLVLGLFALYIRHQRRKLMRERKIVEQLRIVDKLRDDFLANTSHELRTPLNGIIGLAESLRDGATGVLPQATTDHLRLIISIGQRLSALVNNILDFSQLKTRALKLKTVDVNVTRLVDLVFSLAGHTLDREITLQNELNPQGLVVRADEDRLLQILQNLIANAIKFSHAGRVRVFATTDDEQTTLHVEDTGIGIPADKCEQIFQSFRQVDEDADRQYGGAGLGLAICWELVRLHGGTMWVTSEPGRGSTFSFSLPGAATLANQAPVEQLPPSEPAPVKEPFLSVPQLNEVATVQPLAPTSQRILVVDDEVINCTVLRNHLQEYHVTVATDGASCLQRLEQESFDLVLLDVMMPRMSGYEVCRRLRKQFAASDLPVILISARNQVTDLMNGFDCGANDYLTKPITKGELLSRVRTHLALRESHRSLEQRIQERTIELQHKNEEIVRTQKKLIMQEKLASLGSMTSGIAHELRNPLNFIHGLTHSSTELFVELKALLARPSDPSETIEEAQVLLSEMDENLNVVLKHARRASAILENMMALSSGGGGKFQPVQLGPLVESQVRLLSKEFRCQGIPDIDIKLELLDPDPTVMGVARELNRVLTHLLKNAFESLAEKGEKSPEAPRELRVWTQLEDGFLLLGIRDTGVGIPKKLQKTVFEPFFTTKPPDTSHIGLGLSIVYQIVASHEGEIRLNAEPGQFAEFIVVLPRAKE